MSLWWPFGDLGAGLRPAPGSPEGHPGAAIVPHELRYPEWGTPAHARNKTNQKRAPFVAEPFYVVALWEAFFTAAFC